MRDVVISGGGPVGLGLAIELGQRGHSVTVVERHETPPRIPKGQNLTQRTMEHMRAWGVERDIRAAKTIPDGVGMGGLTAYDTLLSGYHYDWFRRASVDPYYFAKNERLPQYATEAVLRARVSALPSVELLAGLTTTEVTQDADHVTLTARDGDDSRKVRGRYLVGCDGSRSLVRQSAGIPETQQDHDRPMVLVVFSSPEFFDLIREFKDKQFYNVLHPDLDGYWMFFGMVEWGKSFFFHAPVPRGTQRDNFDFAALIRRAIGQEVALELDYVGFWDLRISHADQYRIGRIFIAGDAAHSHPPYGGYGINTGFEDARNLGWKLSAILDGWGGADLLDSYHSERHPVFASTAHDFIDKFIRDDRAFVRANDPRRDKAGFERAWTERATGGAVQGIAGFSPHYGGSPIVTGAAGESSGAKGIHEFTARAGHHLAPAPADHPTVFDVSPGPGFLLLTTETAPLPADIPARVVEMPPEVADHYGAKCILVRPDGFVAWAGADPTDLLAAAMRARGH